MWKSSFLSRPEHSERSRQRLYAAVARSSAAITQSGVSKLRDLENFRQPQLAICGEFVVLNEFAEFADKYGICLRFYCVQRWQSARRRALPASNCRNRMLHCR